MDYMQLLGKKEYAGALAKGAADLAGSAAKGFDLGAFAKGIDVGSIAKGIDVGSIAKGIDTGAIAKGIDTGAIAKGIDTGAIAKNADELAAAASKKVDDVASAASKKADDVAAAGSKNADELASSAGKKAGEETSASLSKKAKDITDKAASMLKKVDPKTVAMVAAAGGLGLYLVNKVKTMEGKKVGITKVEAGQAGTFGIGGNKKVVLLTYSPALEIRSTDKVDIDGSATTPSMDGKKYDVKSVKSETQIYVTVTNDITEYKEGGTITLHTDFESQALGLVKDGAEAAGEAAGEVGGAGANALLKGLGIDPSIAMYVGIGLGVVIVLFILMKLLKKRG